MKKLDIDKVTTDKPVWFPLDRHKKCVLLIHHELTGCVIKTRGWSLNEVLAIMDWKFEDVWAIYRRPWRKDRGVVLMSPSPEILEGLDKLNEKGGSE